MSQQSEQGPMRLVFVADGRVAMPLTITLVSALHHLRPDTTVEVAVVVRRFPQRLRRRVERLTRCAAEAANVTMALQWQEVGDGFEDLPQVAHLPPIVYVRLRLDQLLPRWDRVLYLDTDLLVGQDLRALWEVHLGEHVLAAVADLGIPALGSEEGLSYASADLRKAGICPTAPAFNSGVMLLDLAGWRREGVGARALDFVQRHRDRLQWADQDGLNYACAGRWLALPPDWNVPTALVHGRNTVPWAAAMGYGRFTNGRWEIPAVYHFIGRNKPWLGGPQHPSFAAYRNAIMSTGWVGRGMRGQLWRVGYDLAAFKRSMRIRWRRILDKPN